MKLKDNYMIIPTLEIVNRLSKFLNREISTKTFGEQIQLKTISKIKECKLVLPNEIKVSGCVIGLLKGEMLFSRKCLSSFVFANSSPTAITLILDFLKNLGVSIKDLSICLEISCKNVKDIKKLKENAIEFWKRKTDIPLQILKERIKMRFEFKPNAPYGNLQLRIGNKILRGVIQVITNLCIDVSKKNKKFSVDFIRGLIAAEGNININRKTKCLRMVRISAKSKADRVDYKRALKCCGVKIYSKDMKTISKKEARKLNWKSNGRGGAVLINRFSNFIILLEINAFEICQEKRDKFLSGLIEMRSVKNLLRFQKLPGKFTLEVMKERFDLSSKPIRTKNNFLKLGFIRRISGTGEANDPLVFELTERAKRIIKLMNSHFGLK